MKDLAVCSVLHELGPVGRVPNNEDDWEEMIRLGRLILHLGLIYICFGCIEASCSRQMGHRPVIHSLRVVLPVEMTLAAVWTCESRKSQRSFNVITS